MRTTLSLFRLACKLQLPAKKARQGASASAFAAAAASADERENAFAFSLSFAKARSLACSPALASAHWKACLRKTCNSFIQMFARTTRYIRSATHSQMQRNSVQTFRLILREKSVRDNAAMCLFRSPVCSISRVCAARTRELCSAQTAPT